jgi:hypothetical protein
MKKILAIGGAVIKTALPELRKVIEDDKIEMLIHNGASLFHDFQIATDITLKERGITSYPLEELLQNCTCNKQTSELVWDWINSFNPPENSITKLCEDKHIPVLCFTVLGADFWQLYDEEWDIFALKTKYDFDYLKWRMTKPFHFICMGSAVIHPEVFLKALAVSKPKEFKADVVDFLDLYRPRSRVACYGNYYKMSHKEFLTKWLSGEINI